MTNRVHSLKLVFLVPVVAGMLTVGCGGPTAPSGNTNLRLMLTDDPIDDVTEVNIYFTSVTAKPVGQPPEELTLQLQENPIDLLTLADEVTGFAAGAVAPGEYEFIHVNIDQSQSHIVENGLEKSLIVPSEEVKILGRFSVDDNQLTTLTLDFDAKASLVRLGNGEWLLKPIIVITGNNTSSQP